MTYKGLNVKYPKSKACMHVRVLIDALRLMSMLFSDGKKSKDFLII